MNKFEALLKKQVSHIYTTKDPLLFHEPANEVPVTSDYQRVSYMSSRGLFYIDTGTKVKQNTKICIAIDVEDESLDQRICGAYGPGVSIATKNGYFRVFNSSNQNELTDAQVLDNINIIESYEDKIKINGREITLQNSTSASNSNIILFGANYQNSLYQVSDCRIYYCDIYEGETLVKSFIPVYHKTTHEVGMLDTVNDVFYKAKTQLPDAYEEVEYIESDGTGYIDTRIIPGSNTDIELKFKYTNIESPSSNYRLFGSRGNGSSDRAFYIGLNSTRWYINYNDISNYSMGVDWGEVDTNIHTIKNNGEAFYFDDVNVVTFHSGTFTGVYNAIMFGANSKGTILASHSRIYYCKIKQGSSLVRNFIPCYRKSDNVAGMYDLIGKAFYDSETESTFTAGNIALPDIGTEITNTSLVKKLPDAYQQLEYIESDGTGQYFDLGIKPTSNTEIELNVYATRQDSNALFGSRNGTTSGNTSTRMLLFLREIDGYQRISPQFSSNSANNYTTAYTGFINIKFNKYGCYVNNTTIETYTTQIISGTTYNLYLFTFNEAGTPDSRYFIGKLKSFKLWDNGVLLRDLIPCYKKSDGQEGLYDLVSKTFYPAINNRNFTRGPVLDEYIETITDID